MSIKDTLNRAYGNVAKEPVPNFNLEWIPTSRGIKYYWLKLIRFFTR